MFRTRELSKARVHKLPNTASRRRRVCRGAAFAVTGIDVVRGGIPSLDTSVRGQQDILVVNHQMMSRRGHCCRRRIRRVHHQGHGQLAPINQRPAPFLIATTTQMRIQVDPLRSNFSNQSAQMLLLISHRGEENGKRGWHVALDSLNPRAGPFHTLSWEEEESWPQSQHTHKPQKYRTHFPKSGILRKRNSLFFFLLWKITRNR